MYPALALMIQLRRKRRHTVCCSQVHRAAAGRARAPCYVSWLQGLCCSHAPATSPHLEMASDGPISGNKNAARGLNSFLILA